MLYLNEILQVVKKLNGDFSSFYGEIETFYIGDEVKLIIYGNKHYFFAEYIVESDFNNLRKIEDTILYSEYFLSNQPKPQQCYLIMFYKVEAINESIFKKVIETEENEFFFKRYVLYFSQNEFDAFINWFNSHPNKELSALLALGEIETNMESPHIQFFLRLIIKVPFLNLTFKEINLSGFDTLFHSTISKMRGDKPKLLEELLNEVQSFIDTAENADKAAEEFFEKKAGTIIWDTK